MRTIALTLTLGLLIFAAVGAQETNSMPATTLASETVDLIKTVVSWPLVSAKNHFVLQAIAALKGEVSRRDQKIRDLGEQVRVLNVQLQMWNKETTQLQDAKLKISSLATAEAKSSLLAQQWKEKTLNLDKAYAEMKDHNTRLVGLLDSALAKIAAAVGTDISFAEKASDKVTAIIYNTNGITSLKRHNEQLKGERDEALSRATRLYTWGQHLAKERELTKEQGPNPFQIVPSKAVAIPAGTQAAQK